MIVRAGGKSVRQKTRQDIKERRDWKDWVAPVICKFISNFVCKVLTQFLLASG